MMWWMWVLIWIGIGIIGFFITLIMDMRDGAEITVLDLLTIPLVCSVIGPFTLAIILKHILEESTRWYNFQKKVNKILNHAVWNPR